MVTILPSHSLSPTLTAPVGSGEGVPHLSPGVLVGGMGAHTARTGYAGSPGMHTMYTLGAVGDTRDAEKKDAVRGGGTGGGRGRGGREDKTRSFHGTHAESAI